MKNRNKGGKIEEMICRKFYRVKNYNLFISELIKIFKLLKREFI